MKKKISIFLIILSVLFILSAPHVPECFALDEPDIISDSALLYCFDTDDYICEKNIDEQAFPYSTTKIMTVYLAATMLDPDEVVTISVHVENISRVRDYSVMGLIRGEEVTVRDLMYGTMMLSGNDSATALGEYISGDEKAFGELMTETAKKMGCNNTNFTNPSGIRDGHHYTTARDLFIIAQTAFENETVRTIAGTKTYKAAATNKHEARTFHNIYDLIYESAAHVICMKTGSWDIDSTAVFMFKQGEFTFLGTVMKSGEPDSLTDEHTLINYARKYANQGWLIPKYGITYKKAALTGCLAGAAIFVIVLCAVTRGKRRKKTGAAS